MPEKKKLKVCMVGMSPAIVRRVRLKGIPLAPLALKAYADKCLDKESPGSVDLKVQTFYIEETAPKDMAGLILAEKPDIVAFSVYIWSYLETMECARVLKEKNKRIRIICGGPHVSPMAMEVMREHLYIDAIPFTIIPGEIIFYNLIKAFLKGGNLGMVEGIIYRSAEGSLVKTGFPTEVLDYAKVPSPYLNDPLSLIPGESYVISLEGSRGCPYACGYCFNGRGMRKVNFFPLEKMLKEIEVIYNHPDVKYVFYADADLFIDKKRAEAIIKHIIKQKSSVISEIPLNILSINENLARLLASLPYNRFCFALQTANPRAMESISKLRPRVESFAKKVNEFKSWLPEAAFSIDVMLGLPGDNLAGFKDTLDFCLSLKPERIALNYPVYLLPGSRFFEERDSLGLRYNLSPNFCVTETETFPKKDIETALRLVLWVDILTYFYPAIAKFFHDTSYGMEPGNRLSRIEGWVDSIENDLNLFDPDLKMVEAITQGSLHDWNKLKAKILRKASEAESGYKIYDAILGEEGKRHAGAAQNIISLGINIFDYLRKRQISSVEFSDFDKLPDSIIHKFPIEQIKGIFSRYRR